MAGIPEKMVEYLLETRIDAASIYAIPLVNNKPPATTETANLTLNSSFFNNYSLTQAVDTATNDALTKSCCIDYSDLPLRFVDDLDTNSGYASDGNINYCSNSTNPAAQLAFNTPPSSTNYTINRLSRRQKSSLMPSPALLGPPLMFVVDNLDVSLEDFILTHIIFMPSNVLCNYLKNYYNKRRHVPTASSLPLPPQLQNAIVSFMSC